MRVNRLLLDQKNKPLNGTASISRVCHTPSEAKSYVMELTTALKQLKAFIDDNKDITAKGETFEL